VHPRVFNTSIEGCPFEFCTALVLGYTRKDAPIKWLKKFYYMFLRLYAIPPFFGWMDEQMEMIKQYHGLHAMHVEM